MKLNYMVVRTDEVRKIHLSEISVLMIESTAVSMTSMLLCELCRRKVKVIFCDEAHNPYGEIIPHHGSHDSPSKLRAQVQWDKDVKDKVWGRIIEEKIRKQALILSRFDYERSSMLIRYSEEVVPGDPSNREGHAAKVYFNTLFGEGFSRKNDCVENNLLNYGYSIILSAVNREISALGYSTELGIFHDNMYNHFNLGSDIMEPLRPLVDRMVLDMRDCRLDSDAKRCLANILNQMVSIEGKNMHLLDALPMYVKSVTDSMDHGDESELRFCCYEGTCNEADRVLRPSGEDKR
ncbi:MAG: type II CRISPR-associated endonuclease Cas1 [Candidatus Methanomethylophilaceae archaeon]|nr:type II CRISPR-associated endonuclease Cas1 [Candidatus Methanomethylophilaceae archaeon]